MTQPVDYRDVRAFSQSSLKLLDFSVTKFYREEYKWVTGELQERPESYSSDAMTLGSIVDALLTQPDELDKQFIFVSEVPSGQLKQFIDVYHNLEQIAKEDGVTITNGILNDLAKQAFEEVGFKREKLDTVIGRFQNEGLVYYNALLKSNKRIVLTEVKTKAEALVRQLQEDEYTGPIIKLENVHPFDPWYDGEHIEVLNQLAIYWEEHGLKFKALLDKVVVDHTNKTIQPYDIKTTGSSDFRDAFGNYRYDLQGAFYTDALHHWMDQMGLKDYTIKAFVFIVVFTNEKGIGPQLWQMGTYDYYAGRYGLNRPKLKEVRGYQALVADLLWHIKENKWKYPREVYLKNGLRELNYYVDAPIRG